MSVASKVIRRRSTIPLGEIAHLRPNGDVGAGVMEGSRIATNSPRPIMKSMTVSMVETSAAVTWLWLRADVIVPIARYPAPTPSTPRRNPTTPSASRRRRSRFR